jgi:1,2-dihydroxy-3-keto-5-methylthiopentene dioxygenase
MRAMYVLNVPVMRLGTRLEIDKTQYVHAMRLFKDEPKWTPLNRSEDLDSNPHRKQYVSQFLA